MVVGGPWLSVGETGTFSIGAMRAITLPAVGAAVQPAVA
jgi:hypothetical protein